MFPEIDYLKVDKSRGMNISVVTTAKTDEEARRLLQLMGMPFRQLTSARAGRTERERLGHDGDDCKDRQGAEDAEVRGPAAQPLPQCGRPRAYLRKFALCRLCFRELALAARSPA